jgi:hypothetical protein
MANMMMQKKGFVLAFSLLISSIVLALAFGIFNILLKQIVLTGSAKDSQIAFYAADAGAECALYWDTHNSRTIINSPEFFDTNGNPLYSYTGMFSLPDGHPDFSIIPPYPNATVLSMYLANQNNFTCGASISSSPGLNGGPLGATNFKVNLTSDGKVCALVLIEKGFNIRDTGFDTIIQSRGYNDCAIGNTRRVERAIEVKY